MNESPRPTNRQWIARTFAGWCGGLVLAILLVVVAESLGSPPVQVPVALGVALGVGFAQSRLIEIRRSRWLWVAATAAGLGLPFAVLDAATLAGLTSRHDLAALVAAGGLLVSVLQWSLLRGITSNATLWLLASPAGWLLGGSTAWVSDRLLPRIPGIVGALLYLGIIMSGGLVLGFLTALARPRPLDPARGSER